MERATMTTENQNLALRPREAAKALGVSQRTLWGWTHDGTVPHLRIGRTILYPTEALRDWLRVRSKAPKADGGNDANA
jgi:excisionase family DNA binding protein